MVNYLKNSLIIVVSSAPADLATQVESSLAEEDSAKTHSDSVSPQAKHVT